MDTEQVHAITAANRRLAAEMFAGLDEEQWRTPSLCAGWTVREVCAHLVPPERPYSFLGVVVTMLRYRGDLDRMVDETTREVAARPTATLVAQLRERADMRLDPPVVGPAGPLTDSAVHLRDAARPLGLAVSPEPPAWRPVLDFLVSKPATRGFLPAARLRGLRFVVTDQDWASGEGVEVRGTSEAVALGIAGRPVVLPELDGDGVGVLSTRLAG